MAKSEKMFTINKAQKYLAEQGMELSTQQVRNLARTNEIIMAGVQEYTDPVSEETYKVITQSALDGYVTWKRNNPDVARGGRKASNEKRYSAVFTAEQVAQANAWLTSQGFATLELPVRKPRKNRATDPSSEVAQPVVDGVSSDVDLSALELIEVE